MASPKGEDPRDLLGSLEARIMEDLWEHPDSAVKEVLARLNEGRRRGLAYNTVMSVMARLEQKALLTRERDGRAYRYTAAVTPGELVDRRAQDAVDDVVAEFGDAALAGFVESVRSDDELRAKLRRIVAEAE